MKTQNPWQDALGNKFALWTDSYKPCSFTHPIIKNEDWRDFTPEKQTFVNLRGLGFEFIPRATNGILAFGELPDGQPFIAHFTNIIWPEPVREVRASASVVRSPKTKKKERKTKVLDLCLDPDEYV